MHACCAFYYADRVRPSPTDRTHFWHFSPHLMYFLLHFFFHFSNRSKLWIENFRSTDDPFESDSAAHNLYDFIFIPYCAMCVSRFISLLFSVCVVFLSRFSRGGLWNDKPDKLSPEIHFIHFIVQYLLLLLLLFRSLFGELNKDSFIIC